MEFMKGWLDSMEQIGGDETPCSTPCSVCGSHNTVQITHSIGKLGPLSGTVIILGYT